MVLDDDTKLLLVFRMYGMEAMPVGTVLYAADRRFGLDGRDAMARLESGGVVVKSLAGAMCELTDTGKARLATVPVERRHMPGWNAGGSASRAIRTRRLRRQPTTPT